MRSRDKDSVLNLLLVGFYPQNQIQESALASFAAEDVLLVTDKFRIIENVDKIVHLTINSSNLLIFPILINIMAITIELPQVESDNIILTIETKDYVDQDYITQKLECYHLKSAQHLASTTSSIKVGSVLFISRELTLMLTRDNYIVHLRTINFAESQKSGVNLKTPANLPWLNETPTNKSNTKSTFPNKISTNKLNTVTALLNETLTNKSDTEATIQNEPLTNKSSAKTAAQHEPLGEESCTETTTRTIATRVKGSRRKKTTTIKPYFRSKECPKVTDLAKIALSNQNDRIPDSSTS
ncbi:1629_t:CDS:2 [Scutellospora calospora]|uniref:1629_t:CDS:1 n=1 Tax=Scutellospora calospora TaxID=85575 RepID=A0ACA9KHW5_9GLOM|nr:1629_t:CDS:2 [Scutellospora calospora]